MFKLSFFWLQNFLDFWPTLSCFFSLLLYSTSAFPVKKKFFFEIKQKIGNFTIYKMCSSLTILPLFGSMKWRLPLNGSFPWRARAIQTNGP